LIFCKILAHYYEALQYTGHIYMTSYKIWLHKIWLRKRECLERKIHDAKVELWEQML